MDYYMPFKDDAQLKEHQQRKNAAVKKWRIEMKNKIVFAAGGKCQICSYDKCGNALEFHHIDPSSKEFPITRLTDRPRTISKYADELKKCILLCSNCHREVHAGITILPETYDVFDENKMVNIEKPSIAPKEKTSKGKLNYISNPDFLEGLMKYSSQKEYARILGVSLGTLKRHLTKIRKVAPHLGIEPS